jgi:hypothetical protein
MLYINNTHIQLLCIIKKKHGEKNRGKHSDLRQSVR